MAWNGKYSYNKHLYDLLNFVSHLNCLHEQLLATSLLSIWKIGTALIMAATQILPALSQGPYSAKWIIGKHPQTSGRRVHNSTGHLNIDKCSVNTLLLPLMLYSIFLSNFESHAGYCIVSRCRSIPIYMCQNRQNLSYLQKDKQKSHCTSSYLRHIECLRGNNILIIITITDCKMLMSQNDLASLNH